MITDKRDPRAGLLVAAFCYKGRDRHITPRPFRIPDSIPDSVPGFIPNVYKSTLFLEPIFYLSKYSLSEVYLNIHRLLIEFNGLWYSLAARQVFVAIANPDSLSFG